MELQNLKKPKQNQKTNKKKSHLQVCQFSVAAWKWQLMTIGIFLYLKRKKKKIKPQKTTTPTHTPATSLLFIKLFDHIRP